MQFLVFRLYAPLASWGATAVGEQRPSSADPSQSALGGLLAAALGIRREEEQQLDALHRAYAFTVAMISPGRLLRDYHTAQVPGQSDLKKRPHRTRADELAVPKRDLNTILSTRDYRQDGVWLVAMESLTTAPPYSVDQIKAALQQPKFTLYLGRKSCPPALPLCPQVVTADTAEQAFAQAVFPRDVMTYGSATKPQHFEHERLTKILTTPIQRVAWSEAAHAGYGEVRAISTVRKDRVLSRRRWQFGDRVEQVALLHEPQAVAESDSEE